MEPHFTIFLLEGSVNKSWQRKMSYWPPTPQNWHQKFRLSCLTSWKGYAVSVLLCVQVKMLTSTQNQCGGVGENICTLSFSNFFHVAIQILLNVLLVCYENNKHAEKACPSNTLWSNQGGTGNYQNTEIFLHTTDWNTSFIHNNIARTYSATANTLSFGLRELGLKRTGTCPTGTHRDPAKTLITTKATFTNCFSLSLTHGSLHPFVTGLWFGFAGTHGPEPETELCIVRR